MRKIFLVGVLIFAATCSSAQEVNYIDGSSYNAFGNVKGKMAVLLAENQKLEAEYNLLSQEAQGLLEETDQHNQEIARLQESIDQYNKRSYEKQHASEKFQNDLSSVQSDILIKQSKIALLRKQSLDLEEKFRETNRQVVALEEKKRLQESQIQLAIELKEQQRVRDLEEVEMLKKQLKSIQDKIVVQDQMALKSESEIENFPEKIQALSLETSELRTDMNQLQAKIEFKRKENELLKDKNSFQKQSNDITLKKQQEFKNDLEQKVVLLEEDFSRMDQMVDHSLSWQTNKKDMLEKIIKLDQDNQQLKNKMGKLKEEIETLK